MDSWALRCFCGGPGGPRPSSVASWSRPRLGHLKFCCWVKIPVGTPQASWLSGRIPIGTVSSWPRSQLGNVLWRFGGERSWDTSSLKCCNFFVGAAVGTPEVLWLLGQEPGWETSSFVASWSRSRLGHCLKFCFWVRNAGWDTSSFVASWSRPRLGHPKFCGF